MDWRPGQGVGVKMTRKHRRKMKTSLTQEQQQTPSVKVYGVSLPPTTSFLNRGFKNGNSTDEDEDDDNQNVNYNFLKFYFSILEVSNVICAYF